MQLKHDLIYMDLAIKPPYSLRGMNLHTCFHHESSQVKGVVLLFLINGNGSAHMKQLVDNEMAELSTRLPIDEKML